MTPAPLPKSKIVICTHEFSPFRGGAATYSEELAAALHRAGEAVEVWAPDYGERGTVDEFGFPVVRLTRGGEFAVWGSGPVRGSGSGPAEAIGGGDRGADERGRAHGVHGSRATGPGEMPAGALGASWLGDPAIPEERVLEVLGATIFPASRMRVHRVEILAVAPGAKFPFAVGATDCHRFLRVPVRRRCDRAAWRRVTMAESAS